MNDERCGREQKEANLRHYPRIYMKTKRKVTETSVKIECPEIEV
jgi:hypothetical protein